MKHKSKFKDTEIGRIPEDWDFEELEKHAKIIMGQSPESKYYNKIGNGALFLQGIRTFGSLHPNYDTWTTKVTKLAKKNSILLSVRAPVGEVNIADQDICIGRGLMSIDGKNNKFIFYLFRGFKGYVIKKETGTVYGSVTRNDIAKLKFPFPEEKEQSSIAKILSDLDSKSELNQQMNKVLEAIGQALFKRWFVDFEFPNEKGKPYKSSGGEMIDSELGEIPRGWKVEKLGNFIRVERGLSYKGSGLCEEGIPLINLGNIAPNNNFKYEGLKFYSGDYKERNLVKPCDLIIANTDITQKREVLGSCLIVPSDLGSDKLLFTHHIYAIRPLKDKDALPKHFLSYLLQTAEYRERATGFATGTTVLALPEDAILDFNFVMSNRKILQEFDMLLTFIKERSSKNIMESKNLSQIRDSLLPRLMSGKIRVKV